MYINIPVKPAYAFDYLAILEVKLKKQPKNKTLLYEICKVTNLINNQIGGILFANIYDSYEYNALIEINEKVFEAVEKAKEDEIKASEVDNLNYQRFVCKQALQKTFFDNSTVEIKIGY